MGIVHQNQHPRHTMPIDADLMAADLGTLSTIAMTYGEVHVWGSVARGYCAQITSQLGPTVEWSSTSDLHESQEAALREAIAGARFSAHRLYSAEMAAKTVTGEARRIGEGG